MGDLRATIESLGRRGGAVLRGLGAAALFLFAAWAELALLFKAPLGAAARPWLAALAAAVFLAAAAALLLRRFERLVLPVALVMILVLLGWWSTLTPSVLGQWPAEVMRNTAVAIKGDDVEVRNVRTFRWNGPATADERWEDRIYTFSDLKSVDLFVSEPKNGGIPQSFVSFVFGAGPPLALSLELRGDRGESISALAGLFRKYTVAMIAADETDAFRMRTSLRGERLFRYRLPLKTEAAAKLLTAYAARSQDLHNRPEFFNTLWNQGASVLALMRAAGLVSTGTDYRALIPGRDAEVLYGLDLIEKAKSFDEARHRADITDIARNAALDSSYSTVLRQK